jgi:hypothetical protein
MHRTPKYLSGDHCDLSQVLGCHLMLSYGILIFIEQTMEPILHYEAMLPLINTLIRQS